MCVCVCTLYTIDCVKNLTAGTCVYLFCQNILLVSFPGVRVESIFCGTEYIA